MPIDPKDFQYIRQLVRQKSSIVLDEGKEALVESRLSILARREGIESVPKLMSRLVAERGSELENHVIEAMTTNETLFFRDIYPFDVLRLNIIPKLIEERRTNKYLNILSAGCSSGQEPYSIAMILKENFNLHDWKIRLTACDLSQEMLARGKEGIYSQFEVNRGLPASFLIKYFHQKGVDWQIREDIRHMVEFKEMNLAKPWPHFPPLDIIFMRNVLIYFDIPTKKSILTEARKAMQPNGYLFMGTAETTLNLDEGFHRLQWGKAWCYQPGKDK